MGHLVLSTQKPLPDWMQDPAGLWLQPHLPLIFFKQFLILKGASVVLEPGFVFCFLILLMVELIYIVLISAVWPSDSVIYTFFFIFFSIIVYHRILNIVPCAI